MEIASRVALVTGGSHGIGRAIVEGLLAEGWQVSFCGRSPERVEAALAALEGRFGDRVRGCAADVRSPQAVEELVAWTLREGGRLDCLVNNAGVGRFAAVDEISREDWSLVLDTNLSAAFQATRAVAPVMKRQGSGWIVNIASLASRNTFAGGAAYCASKAGLLALSDCAMLDLRHHGIRVAVILPGSVDTDFEGQRQRGSGGWMLAPEDVARAVLDLVRYPDRALPSRVELRPTRPPKG